jgi:transcriptional regulator with XRE-family HTH domain
VDALQLGSALRTVRLRLGLRQADVAQRAGVSQVVVSRIERGRAASMRLRTLLSVAEAIEASVNLGLRWRGGELPRILNAGHAAMHEAAARLFGRHPAWLIAPEATFAIYGERGAIDVLAFHPGARLLLVVELKTQIVDVQDLISSVDRYRRLAPRIAADREWRASAVSTLVLLRDTTTNRRAVAAHAAVLRAAFPLGSREMGRWLRDPSGPVNGLAFLPDSRLRAVSARQAGVRRVRQRGASVQPRRVGA